MVRLRLVALPLSACLILGSASSNTRAEEPPSRPTVVEIGLYLIDIARLNEREGTFGVELDVVTRYHDPRRTFDAVAEGSDRRVYRQSAGDPELAGFWRPGLQIVNRLGSMNLGEHTTIIHADGMVVNRARIDAVLRAPLDFHEFPFDRQELPIQVESYAYDSGHVVLKVEREFSGFDPDFDMPEWRILGSHGSVVDTLRPQEGRSYSRLVGVLEVQRKSGYYLWKLFLPLIVIAMISWVVFWMSNDALGRRAGVSATGMLTVIAYQFVIAGSLPRFPYLTILDKVALLTLVIIGLTMIENMATSGMTSERRVRVDRSCRVFFPLLYFGSLCIFLIPALR